MTENTRREFEKRRLEKEAKQNRFRNRKKTIGKRDGRKTI